MTPDLTLWKQYCEEVRAYNRSRIQPYIDEYEEKWAEFQKLSFWRKVLVGPPTTPPLWIIPTRSPSYEDFLTWQVNGKQFKEEK